MIVFALLVLLLLWDIMVLHAEKKHYIYYQDDLFVDDGKKITMKETMQQYNEIMHKVKTNKQQ